MCVTAGNKVLGFLALYGPVARLIMCIVGVYSEEEEVKEEGEELSRLAFMHGALMGEQIIPTILKTDKRRTGSLQ